MKKTFLLLLFIGAFTALFAQSVGINTDGTTPHSSAILDIKSISKGLLVPRMTRAQRNSIVSPANGLLIYQNDSTAGFYYYNDNGWTPITGATQTPLTGWSATGNSGLDSTVNFVGTTDGQPLIGKVNGQQVFKFSNKVKSTIVGTNAGIINLGDGNTFLGYESGKQNSRGTANSFVGSYAGMNNTTGQGNTAVGYAAGYLNDSGGDNTSLGSYAGYSNKADNNVFVGHFAGFNNTTGKENLYIGDNAGASNFTGSRNIFIGFKSGFTSGNGSDNLMIGYQAGQVNAGSNNLFTGNEAGLKNTTGVSNYFAGMQSGISNTTGSYNLFIGNYSGLGNTTGSINLFIGRFAGAHNSGEKNHFTGFEAGYSNTTGIQNFFNGLKSGHANTTGSNNHFEGLEAGFSNSTGSDNYFSGFQSGHKNTTGAGNIAVGFRAGLNLNGNSNVMMGYAAGYSNTAGNGNVFLGNNAGYQETGSNRLYIDNNATAAPLIYGRFDENLARINGVLQVFKTAASGSATLLNLKEVGDIGVKVSYTNTFTNNYWYTYSKPNATTDASAYHALNYVNSTGIKEVLYLYGDGDAILFGSMYQASDQRLKKNIKPFTNALSKIRELKAYTYNWNNPSMSQKEQVGFIAQEVEKVFPQFVKEDDKGTKSVAYSNMIPVLMQAINEQQKEIDDLKKLIAEKLK